LTQRNQRIQKTQKMQKIPKMQKTPMRRILMSHYLLDRRRNSAYLDSAGLTVIKTMD
jgi:hypothetical protein